MGRIPRRFEREKGGSPAPVALKAARFPSDLHDEILPPAISHGCQIPLRPHFEIPESPWKSNSGSQPSAQGSADWFTGSVRLDPLLQPHPPARAVGTSVTFEPGARTAWHTHPLGQTLIVTAGCGRAQRWGGPIEEIRPGDVIWIPAGEKHWHGAAPTTAMTHLAIQEQLDGKAVDWLEKVSDEQYRG